MKQQKNYLPMTNPIVKWTNKSVKKNGNHN